MPTVGDFLRRLHPDHAALRRYLVDEEFLGRANGEYWRIGGTILRRGHSGRDGRPVDPSGRWCPQGAPPRGSHGAALLLHSARLRVGGELAADRRGCQALFFTSAMSPVEVTWVLQLPAEQNVLRRCRGQARPPLRR